VTVLPPRWLVFDSPQQLLNCLYDPDVVRASEPPAIPFMAAAAMATSVASVSSVRDRNASPITRLYRPIAASTFARTL